MAVLTEAPRARQEHRCGRRSGQIKAGTRYRLWRIPPWTEAPATAEEK